MENKMKKTLRTLVDLSYNGNSTEFKKQFENELTNRINDYMEKKKKEISSSMMGESNSVLSHTSQVDHFSDKIIKTYRHSDTYDILLYIDSLTQLSPDEKLNVWGKVLDSKELDEVELPDIDLNAKFPWLLARGEVGYAESI